MQRGKACWRKNYYPKYRPPLGAGHASDEMKREKKWKEIYFPPSPVKTMAEILEENPELREKLNISENVETG